MSAEQVLAACRLGLAASIGTLALGVWLPSVVALYVGVVGLGVALVFGLFVLTTPQYTGFLIVGTARERLLWQPQGWRAVTPAIGRVIEAVGSGGSIVFFPTGKRQSSEWNWNPQNLAKFEAHLGATLDDYFQHYVYAPSRRSLVKDRKRGPAFYLRISKGLSDDPESVSKCTQYCLIFLRSGLGQSARAAVDELVATTAHAIASPLVGQCLVRTDLQGLESSDSGISYRGVHKEELPRLSKMKRSWRVAPVVTTNPGSPV